MTTVNIVVSGPVGCGKSAIMMEILAALRAIGLDAEVAGQTPADVCGDPSGSLDIYRDGLKIVITESLFTEHMVERRIGGRYLIPDGRAFWIDALVAREITRRALGLSASSDSALGALGPA